MLANPRRMYSLILISMVALVLCAAPAFAWVPISGWEQTRSVVYDPGQELPGGLSYQGEPWSGAKLSWLVTQTSGTDYWNYRYTLDIGEVHGVSHVITEVTQFPEFEITDRDFYQQHLWDANGNEVVWDGTVLEGPKEHEWSDSSNPGMPENTSVWGIKFDMPEYDGNDDKYTWTTLTWEFKSVREPMWGDFYAKDGKDENTVPKIPIALWNTGFGDPGADTSTKIVRPDGGPGGGGGPPPDWVTPELPPGALLLLGLVPIGIARLRRRK